MKKLIFTLLLTALALAVFAQPPTITSFSPMSGPVGTTVTITGANFSPVAANNIVYFGAVKAPVLLASPISLTVTAPAGATYEPITVTTNGLTGYSNQSFLAVFANSCTDFLPNSFALKTGFDVGGSGRSIGSSIRMADFDGDGKPDVTVVFTGGLSFYRNTSTVGNISFAPKVTYPAPASYQMAVGDLNGDGKLDVVTATGAIHILVNTSTPGTISFDVQLNFQTADNSQRIDYRGSAINDFNGDGKPDLAAANMWGVVSVFRNTTSGGLVSFAAKADFPLPLGAGAIDLEARDLDNDGKPDLGVTHIGTAPAGVLRNTSTAGNISFAPEAPLPVSAGELAIGDLNEDSKPDFVVRQRVLRNNSSTGNIQFSESGNIGGAANFVINDFNGDGKPDLASTNAYNDPYFSVYKNTGTNGEISFAAGVDYGSSFTSPTSTGLEAGDLDGDGKPDLVLGLVFPNPFVVFRNQMGEVPCDVDVVNPPAITSFSPASGTVGTTVTITGANFSPVAANNTVYFGAVKATVKSATATLLTAAVPVGATYQPITVTTGGLTGYSAKPFVVTSNCNNGIISSNSFAPKVDFPAAANPVAVAHGDIDGDGKPDLAVANASSFSGSVSVFRNTSSAIGLTFSARVDFPAFAFSVVGLAIGDIDGDGKLDMVVVNNDRFSVFRNTSTNGTIAFADRMDYPYSPGGLHDITITDIDGDGKPDVAFVKKNSSAIQNSLTVMAARNRSTSGAISFEEIIEFGNITDGIHPSGSSGVPHIAAADLNADGKPDLVITNIGRDNVYILRNASLPGTLSIKYDVRWTTGLNPNGIAIGDLDGDGKPDIAVANLGSNSVSVLRNTSTNGFISFAPNTDFLTSPGTYDVAIGDLEGDGKPDLVVTGNGLVSVLRNMSTSGTISFPARVDFAAPSAGVVIGDLNGDAKPELVGANSGANVVSVLRNQINCDGGCVPLTFNQQVVVDATCGQSNGRLLLTPTSGTAPYQYSLNGGATYVSGPNQGYTFENLSPGTYQLRIKDASGCESAIVQQVLGSDCPTPCTPPTFLKDETIVKAPTCGQSNGSLYVFPASGTAPFLYSINGGTYIRSPTSGHVFQGLSQGVYQLRIKDARGCESEVVQKVVAAPNCPITGLPPASINCATVPTLLNNGMIVKSATCSRSDGALYLIPTAGTAPFLYSINGGQSYFLGPDAGMGFQEIPAGTYQLRIRDARGCESAVITRTVPSGCVTSPTTRRKEGAVLNNSTALVYPNPSTGAFRLVLQGSAAEKADLQVLNSQGEVVERRRVNTNESSIVSFDLTGKAKGLYLIRVVSDKGVQVQKVVIQ